MDLPRADRSLLSRLCKRKKKTPSVSTRTVALSQTTLCAIAIGLKSTLQPFLFCSSRLMCHAKVASMLHALNLLGFSTARISCMFSSTAKQQVQTITLNVRVTLRTKRTQDTIVAISKSIPTKPLAPLDLLVHPAPLLQLANSELKQVRLPIILNRFTKTTRRLERFHSRSARKTCSLWLQLLLLHSTAAKRGSVVLTKRLRVEAVTSC